MSSIVIAVIMVICCGWAVAAPFIRPNLDEEERYSSFEDDTSGLITALRDLELDFHTAKISQEEYDKQKLQLESELASLISRKMNE